MKRHAPAAGRNREPIAAVLTEELPDRGLVLEVASGTGEHAVYFARTFPHLEWQPSDTDPLARDSIEAWRADSDLPNLRAPIALDVMAAAWQVEQADAIVCINMIHISAEKATESLLAGARRLLATGAPLMLYGPFLEETVETAPSNAAFDLDLKARNAEWGLRRIEWLDEVARSHGFERTRRTAMPANNLALVYRRT